MDAASSVTAETLADTAGKALARLRETAPEVHALTSPVAQVLTANVLLAVGAQPSLSQAPGEVEAFAGRTGACLVNLGMLDAAREDAARRMLPILADRGAPWVLDPVKLERSPARAALARELTATWSPAVLRANASEFPEIERWTGLPADLVLARSGPVDEIRQGPQRLGIANGSPLMTGVTALGCAGTAIIAAFLASGEERFTAAAAGLLVMGVAGEIAAEAARGPGSFVPAFLDALFHLDGATLGARARFA